MDKYKNNRKIGNKNLINRESKKKKVIKVIFVYMLAVLEHIAHGILSLYCWSFFLFFQKLKFMLKALWWYKAIKTHFFCDVVVLLFLIPKDRTSARGKYNVPLPHRTWIWTKKQKPNKIHRNKNYVIKKVPHIYFARKPSKQRIIFFHAVLLAQYMLWKSVLPMFVININYTFLYIHKTFNVSEHTHIFMFN